ncbi:hypothetical protein DLAC_03059 [Tieghemostelium lacteum]|uniref:CMP/dCMP-type deaminase domain-containing protein n=1 Tax=Tieghemostelium lacteum TaxID=361077 RepID=A0A152A2H6_TIELA|nr:hypothetical protein DLAC_03059 [Tieghemostelium lacteum]|eukprot:KYR00317.1 hypothetical protein DLAC_03059 [Tieghemostelium lacteum]
MKNNYTFTLFLIFNLLIGLLFACEFYPLNTAVGKCGSTQNSFFQPVTSCGSTAIDAKDLNTTELEMHEARMNIVLDQAQQANRKFVAHIYDNNGTLLCTGVNLGVPNMLAHGEIVAINNCTTLHGLKTFENHTLYTTGEPCAMCAAGLMWSKFSTVVWGSYNHDIHCKICMSNIPMESTWVFDTYKGLTDTPIRVIGGVAQERADAFFGSYCDRPTSIFYIAPQCNCVNKTLVTPVPTPTPTPTPTNPNSGTTNFDYKSILLTISIIISLIIMY